MKYRLLSSNIKLKYLDAENQRRREIAQYYCENIQKPGIILPVSPDFFNIPQLTPNPKPQTPNPLSHVWHLFVIRHPNRDALQNYLAENGIQTLIHYPIPPHKQLAYKGWNELSFPITEKIHMEVLSLPMSPAIKTDELKSVINFINDFSFYK
jgi:dTDP-4-amino-4,6-dideoxygalactose transaminase